MNWKKIDHLGALILALLVSLGMAARTLSQHKLGWGIFFSVMFIACAYMLGKTRHKQ